MWWEALPSGFIVVAGCMFGPIAAWSIHKTFYNGHAYRRSTVNSYNEYYLKRDMRLTGYTTPFNHLGAYWYPGLEAIPDADGETSKPAETK